MEDYKEIKEMLKPRRDFAASEGLRKRVNQTLDGHTRKNRSNKRVWSIVISSMAAAMIVSVFIPSGLSAKDILSEAIQSLLTTEGVEMTVEVRTRPMENFRYIDPDERFVKHHIYIARADTSVIWRIDKGGRTAAGNSHTAYNWIEQYKIGWRAENTSAEELLGELAVFLRPERILEAELELCLNDKGASYSVSRTDEDIIMTARSGPKGNFDNPYMLNASIAESDNIRRYVIDAATKRLKYASVKIISGHRETEVLKIDEIRYGKPRDDLMSLPTSINFIGLPQSTLRGLPMEAATEAAAAFLNALKTMNDTILSKAIDDNQLLLMQIRDFQGAELLSVGNSFISGNEDITFVPYELRLQDGSVKRHNLAMRKNNHGGWIVIGGL